MSAYDCVRLPSHGNLVQITHACTRLDHSALRCLQEWGCEGYHLWLISEQTSEKPTTEENHVVVKPQPKLMLLYFVKSSLAVNPCMVSFNAIFSVGVGTCT